MEGFSCGQQIAMPLAGSSTDSSARATTSATSLPVQRFSRSGSMVGRGAHLPVHPLGTRYSRRYRRPNRFFEQ
jgi:hypothetical protein